MARAEWLRREGAYSQAYYYRMPWVLVAATVMVLLIYALTLSKAVAFAYDQLIALPIKRLAVRLR